MLVLALDTTTRQGSAALHRDGRLIGVEAGDGARTHGERLPNDLLRLLAAHQLSIRDVDVYAVAAGPGSFTGLRIGIAAMQGLALVNGKPLLGVSALDALNTAVRLGSPGLRDPLAVWMDAQRGQIFSAVYGGDGQLEDARVESPAEALARLVDGAKAPSYGHVHFVGDGAGVYSDAIKTAIPGAIVLPTPALAPAIASLAEQRALDGDRPAAGDIQPLYVRRPDAELARDRKRVTP